jgi:hypothetical protein
MNLRAGLPLSVVDEFGPDLVGCWQKLIQATISPHFHEW